MVLTDHKHVGMMLFYTAIAMIDCAFLQECLTSYFSSFGLSIDFILSDCVL